MAQSMPDGDENFPVLEDDYYALLNLDQNATPEDVKNAYRRLSRLYHPDKHNDPERKAQAEILFNKIKKAYEVLKDPHKRAIYDAVGIQGLETEGWLIIERTKTPREIREEYEQLVKEREERRLRQITNPKGTFIVSVNATDIFEFYEDQLSFPSIEISSLSLSQSVEATVNTDSAFTFNGNLIAQNGNGSGSIGGTYRKITSNKGWVEVGLGAGNGPQCNIKGFKHFGDKSFGSIQTVMHFTPLGIAPAVQTVLGQQLTKHITGYITWKAGNESSMKTTISWNSNEGHYFSTDFLAGLKGYVLSCNYRYKLSDDTKLKTSLKFGFSGTVFEYGCDKKFSQLSEIGATMALGVPSGVTLKIRFTRANQTYLFPILLSEEIQPSAVFYGTVVPLISWYMLKLLVIDPLNARKKKKMQEENASKLAERREEALAAVSLMQETYNRIKTQEEAKKGLIIIKAFYGASDEVRNVDATSVENTNVFDVTVQLQCLIKDSRLVLPARSKGNLPGFYDPCLGEEKCLLISYSYKSIAHSITVKDEEMLRIPNER